MTATEKKEKKEIYNSLRDYLQGKGKILTLPMEIEIEILANVIHEIKKVSKIVSENGTTQKTPKSDYRQMSPEFSSLLKLQDQQRAYYDKLGIRDDYNDRIVESKDDLLN